VSNRNANRLRVLRAERDISQMDAAANTGMGLNRWWRIENGYATPTPDEQKAIAKFFGVKARDIFTGEAMAS
jgi:transcriptional regulator with XRE-family HTH domain